MAGVSGCYPANEWAGPCWLQMAQRFATAPKQKNPRQISARKCLGKEKREGYNLHSAHLSEFDRTECDVLHTLGFAIQLVAQIGRDAAHLFIGMRRGRGWQTYACS